VISLLSCSSTVSRLHGMGEPIRIVVLLGLLAAAMSATFMSQQYVDSSTCTFNHTTALSGPFIGFPTEPGDPCVDLGTGQSQADWHCDFSSDPPRLNGLTYEGSTCTGTPLSVNVAADGRCVPTGTDSTMAWCLPDSVVHGVVSNLATTITERYYREAPFNCSIDSGELPFLTEHFADGECQAVSTTYRAMWFPDSGDTSIFCGHKVADSIGCCSTHSMLECSETLAAVNTHMNWQSYEAHLSPFPGVSPGGRRPLHHVGNEPPWTRASVLATNSAHVERAATGAWMVCVMTAAKDRSTVTALSARTALTVARAPMLLLVAQATDSEPSRRLLP